MKAYVCVRDLSQILSHEDVPTYCNELYCAKAGPAVNELRAH